ncbi:dihydroorotase [Endozoicomonas sp. GU-1]|uniref:dihydroorotase n=1 Tax=Endozoicomonas sp. GU-1 TaxID=3009078 RepID=UPI0022B44B11|nr:dihydroorotase [Endozoicomonas sp. GU-1]WBA80194.1 dihydroorotase [Endozoicomonas sp. GU-1]WBA87769.1 dihydroorotase [Endozoicomonas sp. GU-1]
MSQLLTITRPDDWHLHLRDGNVLTETVAATARTFGRAIIMPNLVPPVTDADLASQYKTRILEQVSADSAFQPLMTLYLTDKTSPETILNAHQRGDVVALKLYPAGATTHSDAGVTNLENIYGALETMAECGLPLLVHGEVTDADIDIFDREKTFIDRHLVKLVERFPTLKIIMEHITTADAARFVSEGGENLGATITAHHLLYNRNHMLVGGIKPHYYCLPILKRNRHQQALLEAAVSGNRRFFLGTDSAPHAIGAKESPCGCAGCYTAPAAIELYAEAFDMMGALDKLEAFASFNGPDFYGLPRNQDTITLVKEDWLMPESIAFGDNLVKPLRAGETVSWRLKS